VGWVDDYYGYETAPPSWAGPPPSTLSPVPPAPVTPVLSALKLTVKTFSLGERSHRAVELLVSFGLSQAANVTFALERAVAGRREGDRCVATTKTDRTRQACVRHLAAPGSITRDALAGTDTFPFTGRLDGIALAPGSYQLVAAPASSGTSGTAETATFSVPR
jgi:hypothetical protein